MGRKLNAVQETSVIVSNKNTMDAAAPLSRTVSVKSCPTLLQNAFQEVEPVELVRCNSAPAAVNPLPCWPGADVKVRNTFVHVEFAACDDEFAFLQQQRRDIFSCPPLWNHEEFASKESSHIPYSPTECSHVGTATEPFSGQGADFQIDTLQFKSHNGGEQDPFRMLMASAVEKHMTRGASQSIAGCSIQGEKQARRGKVSAKAGISKEPVSLPTPASGVSRPLHPVSEIDAILYGQILSTDVEQKLELDAVSTISNTGSRKSRSRRGGDCDRLWCHVFIDPCMLEPGFDLIKKLIGKSGCNTRGIFESTGTKVRVRGKGSGHLEERHGREAPVPLMVALAAQEGCPESFCKAFEMTKKLLLDVSNRFEQFLLQQGKVARTGRRFSLGEISKKSLSCLSLAALDGVDLKATVSHLCFHRV
jgi:hypothetical protein